MVNYISISRIHGNIKETLAIDPSLYIPNTLRPPLSEEETEETRKNVRLDAIHGRIEADITLVEPSAVYKPEKKQATMQFSSIHGGIKLRIVSPPFMLNCYSPFLLSARARSPLSSPHLTRRQITERWYQIVPSTLLPRPYLNFISPRRDKTFFRVE